MAGQAVPPPELTDVIPVRSSDFSDAPVAFAVNEKPQIQALKRSTTVHELCELADAMDHDLATEEAR